MSYHTGRLPMILVLFLKKHSLNALNAPWTMWPIVVSPASGLWHWHWEDRAGHNYPSSAPPRWDLRILTRGIYQVGSYSQYWYSPWCIQYHISQVFQLLLRRQYRYLVTQAHAIVFQARQLYDWWAWDHCLSLLILQRRPSQSIQSSIRPTHR